MTNKEILKRINEKLGTDYITIDEALDLDKRVRFCGDEAELQKLFAEVFRRDFELTHAQLEGLLDYIDLERYMEDLKRAKVYETYLCDGGGYIVVFVINLWGRLCSFV